MKRKNDLNYNNGLPAGTPDLERRRITKLIGAMTLLGMGLGVNLDEVFAADRNTARNLGEAEAPASRQDKVRKPEAKYGKVERPSVTQDKYSPAKPGASFAKTSPAKPDASFAKTSPAKPGASFAKTSPAKPGASFAKTSPAKPGVSIAKPVPANKPGLNMIKINTMDGAGEQLQDLPGTK